MKVTSITMASLLTLGLAGGAFAAGDTSSQSEDQSMTQQGTQKQAEFDELDANKDGYVSQDELNRYGSTAAGQDPQQMLQEQDANQDGRISKEEYEQNQQNQQDQSQDEGSW
ncbi:EF-hand domain-containing protein [Marinobacteraceae bacterium S3BR75-40.1]